MTEALDSYDATLLAKTLTRATDPGRPLRLRQGVVTASTYTTLNPLPPQVSVMLPGATTAVLCTFFDHCFPQVGDTVWLLQNGSDLVIVGRVAANIPNEWKAVTLLNSWTNFGAPYNNMEYRVCADGCIELSGMIKHATTTTVGNAFSIPSQFGVVNRRLFPATIANTGLARIAIVGGSSTFAVDSYQGTGSAAFVSFDGVHYMPDYV